MLRNFIIGLVAVVALGLVAVLPGASVSVAAMDGAAAAGADVNLGERLRTAARQRQGAPGAPRQHSENGWDKLVGMKGEDAAQSIRTENPMLHVHIVPQGAMVTTDYRTDRVRVFVDKDGKVTRVPRIG